MRHQEFFLATSFSSDPVIHQWLDSVCGCDSFHLIHQSGKLFCVPEDIIPKGGKVASHAEVRDTDEVAASVLASPIFAFLPVSKM